MFIRFLPHGAGDPKKAVDYLLQEYDHKNVRRAEVKVLRGDPKLFIEVTKSVPHRLRYSSCVIPFSPNDKPTDAEIEQVLDAYDKLTRGGL